MVYVNLEEIFGDTAESRIVQHFLDNPNDVVHLSELSRKVGKSKARVSDAIKRLEKGRFLLVENKNIVIIRMNKSHPLAYLTEKDEFEKAMERSHNKPYFSSVVLKNVK